MPSKNVFSSRASPFRGGGSTNALYDPQNASSDRYVEKDVLFGDIRNVSKKNVEPNDVCGDFYSFSNDFSNDRPDVGRLQRV